MTHACTHTYRNSAKGWLGELVLPTSLISVYSLLQIFSQSQAIQCQTTLRPTTFPPLRHPFIDILGSPLCFCFASRKVSNISSSYLVLPTKGKAQPPVYLTLPAQTLSLANKNNLHGCLPRLRGLSSFPSSTTV